MMNRPRQSPQTPTTRMPMLQALPEISDVSNLLSEVHKFPTKIFHLPWIVEAKGLVYDLACAITAGIMDPEWTLSAGGITGGLSTSVIWSHSSPDMDLILNLCLMESEVPQMAAEKDAQTSLSELKALVSEDIAKQNKDGYLPPRGGPAPPSYPRPASPAGQPAQAAQSAPVAPPAATAPVAEKAPPVDQGMVAGIVHPARLGSPPVMPPPMPGGAPSSAPSGFAPPAPTPAPQALSQTFQQPTHAPPKPGAMAGRLSDIAPNNLLQSIALGLMSGRLRVLEQNSNIELWFEQGMLQHATCREGDGELAVLELLSLFQGDFDFLPDERTVERSISRRIDAIVLDCMTLVQNQQYLENAGLNINSHLVRRNLSLTEVEFDNHTRNIHCSNREMLKTLYQQIDQHSTFLEMQRKFPLTKIEWLPALYTLVTSNLVDITTRPVADGKPVDLSTVGIDVQGMTAALGAILRPDTGIMSFHLLMHFLEQEYYRYERSRLPFTFMVFSIAKNTSFGMHPLDEREARNLAQVVEQIKRKIDVLGHFQGQDYAMILPSTNIAGAKIFANRLMEIVSRGTVCDVPSSNLFFACGLAALPEDGMRVELLVPAAIEARNNSRDTARGVVAYKTLPKANS